METVWIFPWSDDLPTKLNFSLHLLNSGLTRPLPMAVLWTPLHSGPPGRSGRFPPNALLSPRQLGSVWSWDYWKLNQSQLDSCYPKTPKLPSSPLIGSGHGSPGPESGQHPGLQNQSKTIWRRRIQKPGTPLQ